MYVLSHPQRVGSTCLVVLTLMVGIIAVTADNLYGQPGRDRGGPPGRMRGGRGRGGSPGGGPAGFLARLDTNNNGMLDPDEIQGRTRTMLERIAGDGGLDLSGPVPLKAVERAFEAMRNRRTGDRNDNRGGRGREGGRDNDNRNRDRGPGSSRSEPEGQPLVPRFGEVDLFEPVPGFGSLGERFAVTITEEDRQEAQRALSRYDRNKDGILDEEEIRRGRWRPDPLLTDRNGDGKLTFNELALRYAVRRAESEEGSDDSGNRSRGSSQQGSSSSDDNSDRRERFVAMMFGRYDGNNDNVIEGGEMRRLGGRGDQYDLNDDGKITRKEFAEAMSGRFNRGTDDDNRSRFFQRRGGDRNGRDDNSNDSSDNGNRRSGRSPYRIRTPSEQLAELEELPEWFARHDVDTNGQVEMAEYATAWNEEVVADFSQFDLNGDGIITPNECLAAVDRGAVQGAPRSTDSSGDSFGSRNSISSTASGRSNENASPEPAEAEPAAAASAGNQEVSSTYVKYAVGVIKKYDKNQDGVLTPDEWKSMGKDYSSADTDGDERITPIELARAFASQR